MQLSSTHYLKKLLHLFITKIIFLKTPTQFSKRPQDALSIPCILQYLISFFIIHDIGFSLFSEINNFPLFYYDPKVFL